VYYHQHFVLLFCLFLDQAHTTKAGIKKHKHEQKQKQKQSISKKSKKNNTKTKTKQKLSIKRLFPPKHYCRIEGHIQRVLFRQILQSSSFFTRKQPTEEGKKRIFFKPRSGFFARNKKRHYLYCEPTHFCRSHLARGFGDGKQTFEKIIFWRKFIFFYSNFCQCSRASELKALV
jgi:hypothetical protein